MTNPSDAPAPARADIVIVGAGQAGFQVAVSLRQKRFAGSIVLIGDEPYPPYHRPPLSKAALKEGLNEATLWFRPEGFLDKQGITECRGTRVVAIDRKARSVRLGDGSALGYGRLVLATGAVANRLPDALVPSGVSSLVLRTLDDAHALRDSLRPGLHLVVVGAGYIGLEVAASARGLGAEVVVIDREARLMQRTASPTVAAHFQNLHASHGVRFQLPDLVDSIEATPDGARIGCRSGAEIPCELLVAGIGVRPNTALAEACGLTVADGILTDLQGRTSDPAIFAVGDCARHAHAGFAGAVRFESVQSAIDQGKVVAAALMGEDAAHAATPWFWSDQYDCKLQVVGVVEPGHETFIKGDPATGSFAVWHMDGAVPVAVEAINAPHDFVVARKSVGMGQPLAEGERAALTPIAL